MSTVLESRILVLRLALVGAALAAGVTSIKEREYSSDFSFTPVDPANGGLSALASGIGLAMGGGPQSPLFYVDLLKTRQVLGAVLTQNFSYPADTGVATGTLTDLWMNGRGTPEMRRLKALGALRQKIDARADMKTGVVSVTVATESPVLSQKIASSLLAEVNKFNVDSRRIDAAAERDFAKQRLDQSRDSLRKAEDARQKFSEQNRLYNNSPELVREQLRLDRQVSLFTGQYDSNVLSYEHARSEAERRSPVITIVEQPEVAVLSDPRGLVAKTVLGTTLGALFALLLAFMKASSTRRNAAMRDQYEEYEHLLAAAAADLRNPRRTLRQVFTVRTKTPEKAA
jgi:uncharacterized protein involved in exopolysaccharide biosynthesis